MTNHTKNILITELFLLAFAYFFKEITGTTTTEYVGVLFGHTLLPIFNAHLLTQYINAKIISDNELLTMLLVSMISLLIVNPTPILLAILGAMVFSKFRSDRQKDSNK